MSTETVSPPTAKQFEIRHRWTNAVLWTGTAETIKQAVELAVQSKANMQGADMRDADMQGANMQGANMRGANMHGADMRDADMRGADMRGANMRDADMRDANMRDANMQDANMQGADMQDADMRDADMRGANMQGADMQGADMRGANMQGADMQGADMQDANMRDANMRDANMQDADMRGANMRGANMQGANMQGANLTPIRDDFWAVLSSAPKEVAALRAALVAGKVDGSTYSDGECGCLVGTLEIAAAAICDSLPNLKRNSKRPAEIFFLSIKKGDTPKTNQVSKIAMDWLDEWVSAVSAAFAKNA